MALGLGRGERPVLDRPALGSVGGPKPLMFARAGCCHCARRPMMASEELNDGKI